LIRFLLGDANFIRYDTNIANEAVLSYQNDWYVLSSGTLGYFKHNIIVEISRNYEIKAIFPICLEVVCERLDNEVSFNVLGVELQEIGTHDLCSRLAQVIWTKEEVLSEISLCYHCIVHNCESTNLWQDKIFERLATGS